MAEGDNIAALKLIQKDLDLPENEINSVQSPEMAELHRYLTQAIRELLDSDFNRLLNALYRIDIDERKVTQVIHSEDPENIAPNLATMIIDRQLQKVVTRRKYSNPDQE